jgi:lauroyl/myristoyl acyltransferase
MPLGQTIAKPRLDRAGSKRWLQATDLRVLAKLPLSALIAWCVPERYWDDVAGRAARLELGARRRLVRRVASIYGTRPLPLAADELASRHLAALRRDQLAYLRSHAPGGWRRDLALEGLEHLRAALAAGRGAILWVLPNVFAPLIAKRTLHEAGFPLHHLSHPYHGFSTGSWLGQRFVNPLRTRIEDRYLAERIMLGTGNQAQAALRRISALLRRNAAVSITVGRYGSRVAEVPFLCGRLCVASGAPHLAARMGAALLPTTVRLLTSGGFLTQIGPAMPMERGDADEALASAVRRLAEELEAFGAASPEQVHWDHNCIGVPPSGEPI